MSRSTPSVLRNLASSSRRTFTTSLPRAAVSGNTTSVDPRVLSGVPDFLPKANIDRVCDWQSGLWERLQDEVRNNPGLVDVKQKWDRSGLDMTHLVSFTARESNLTLAFNYGSLLLNNSYFLEGLHGDEPQIVPEIYKDLGEKVEAYAEGMVGPGWLWLVRSGDNNADVDIVPTFAAGTLLIHNRAQRGRDELPLFATPPNSGSTTTTTTPSSSTSSSNEAETQTGTTAQVETSTSTSTSSRPRFRSSSQSSTSYPAPLAVLSLFEHAYIGDKYGVWGRKEYARNWWKNLDWKKVAQRSALIV
ncbi:hypothetical protein BCR39DRAFT_515659 [Naematelia encephala]|uniref:Manganese/iron superoxide dismutase C-terminal domain-containing protein n=1 Tax=Naematelia encephala TaxID=71784 RepID=A0A1Y2BJH3_9TREE|nr:hypothetical protein BCR39DRAFT_515659 [Naematelia encephala]